ncbi:SRPBCC family protein [Amycolatopsis sp.]|uniref:SRPBCC family protein n=1 Tax=Amycolatopsis sp. TaxID=37632 RepID=UPI002E04F02E|nr:SRPBCC family protein [Amycolatopsis sp.]
MILDNDITIHAHPDVVFTLINDVERVVTCLPGASLAGRDGDTYRGSVKVKVGPITAEYSGTVKFFDVNDEQRTLRLQAEGTEGRGSGDAEALIDLSVEPAPDGALLRLRTDMLVRGKIAQFGKGAISTVSTRLLGQFAANLAGLLDAPGTGPAAPTSLSATVPTANNGTPPPTAAHSDAELDGLAMLLGPAGKKYLALAGVFVFGLFEGWLLGRVHSQAKQLKAARRG